VFGASVNDNSGFSVSSAGDVNGDGYADVVVGAYRFDGPSGRTDCGAAYMIFGHSIATSFTDIDLAALTSSQGFRVTGVATSDRLGYSVSGAGDFNHDGYSDLVIGSIANKAYVLFGHSSTTTFTSVDLAMFASGSEGFVVSGSGTFGVSVSGGVDVNGDGVDDVVIAASIYASTGAAVVLYGRTQLVFSDIDVQAGLLTVSGFKVAGATTVVGEWAVSLLRDFDGDGVGDVVVGATGSNRFDMKDAGSAYLLYGELSAPTSQPSQQPTGRPSRQPTSQPSCQPFVEPSARPSKQPTGQPSGQPALQPSVQPTALPTSQPSRHPSRQPTSQPSRQPTSQPTSQPSARPTSSPVSERSGDVDLATWTKPRDGLQLWGASFGDNAGISVTDAGDVNKDGYQDLLVGAYLADLPGKQDAGAAYLVFGSPGRSTSTIETAGSILPIGIKILGKTAFDRWGQAVSGAGDVNKDGIDDFIVGAPNFDPPSHLNAGGAVVIFGKTSGWADIDLASFTSGSAGFFIFGAAVDEACGYTVSGAGDVNGDGADDVIVGSFWAAPLSRPGAGTSYVIFGHSTAFSTIDLSAFAWGSAGFQVFGASVNDNSGFSVSSAGDVNGDGYADVVVGAYRFDGPSGRTDCGAAYVVFGHTAAAAFADIDLAALSSSQGFRITGAAAGDQLSYSVSCAGDFNRDGYDDIVVGSNANKAYVIFGHSSATTFSSVDLITTAPGSAGFMISGVGMFGASVNGGVDVNEDGVDDIAITAPSYSSTAAAFVLYGRSQPLFSDINILTGLPTVSGFKVTSAGSLWAVGLVRDFDGDGVGDLVLGATATDRSGIIDAGTAYLLYGELSAPTSQPSQQPTGRPSRQPTSQPSWQPNSRPSARPSRQPTGKPSEQPTSQPSGQPSRLPTSQPSDQPTALPSVQPSREPTAHPSAQPTTQPRVQPTPLPTQQPSAQPSGQPSTQPTTVPTVQPSLRPSSHPSTQPSTQPSSQPSEQPSRRPTTPPSMCPSSQPSSQPMTQPSTQPSKEPTAAPTAHPSTQPSSQPSKQPVSIPSLLPSRQPTALPSSQPSNQPTTQPMQQPSAVPSSQPSKQPNARPTTQPTMQPSCGPSSQPSVPPTRQPTANPSSAPSSQPSSRPTVQPSQRPSETPSSQPSKLPTVQPSCAPTGQPTSRPTAQPAGQPTDSPSGRPSRQPNSLPSVQPSQQPSAVPTLQPSQLPTRQPRGTPTRQPTSLPSAQPSRQPTQQPSGVPTAQPLRQPAGQPSRSPSAQPTSRPSRQPTLQPSHQPNSLPSRQPTTRPSAQPTRDPTGQPSCSPTSQPTGVPSTQPSTQPSRQPTCRPSTQPSSVPT
jgi:hypothetical protein